MMGSWASFWGWTLGISLVLFAVISVVVTIGGFRDIRDLLAQADRLHLRQIQGSDQIGSGRAQGIGGNHPLIRRDSKRQQHAQHQQRHHQLDNRESRFLLAHPCPNNCSNSTRISL